MPIGKPQIFVENVYHEKATHEFNIFCTQIMPLFYENWEVLSGSHTQHKPVKTL